MQREQKMRIRGQDTKASKGVKKTPDTRLVQLNLQSIIYASVKKATVSDRLPQKNPRTSSSDCESARGAPPTFNELKIIQDGISDIRQTMVCKDM